MIKKAIVTGTTGFIGRHLLRILAEQDIPVIAVDRKGADWNRLLCEVHIRCECDLDKIQNLKEWHGRAAP